MSPGTLAFGRLSGKVGGKRTGSFALPIAANSIRLHMTEMPVRAGPGQRYEVGPAGWDGLHLSSVAKRWLEAAPGGPLPLEEDDDEEGPVKVLLDGWNAGIVHALSRRPMTAGELEDEVWLRRRELRRRLVAMREARLLEPTVGEPGGVRYAVTGWLREAIAPLAVASRAELRHPQPEVVPIAAPDVEAAFRLVLPLLEPPGELAGTCRMTVLLDGKPSEASVTVRAEPGRVVALDPGDEPGEADAWATATVEDWLDTVIEPDANRVRTGGDKRLARILLDTLHERLYGV